MSKPRQSYYAEVATKNSLEILNTAGRNLNKFLDSKGRTLGGFTKWASEQGCPDVGVMRIERWPTFRKHWKAPVTSDSTAMICLIALYINKPIQDVMFTDIPYSSL